jgi:hypothetical protein
MHDRKEDPLADWLIEVAASAYRGEADHPDD